VVENDLETALILEDDVDWDVRIKQQMADYAATIRALSQPLASSPSTFADPTFLNPDEVAGQPTDMSFKNLPRTVAPRISPYGDNWDVLWLGHCGTEAPNANYQDEAKRKLSQALARGRVVHYDDETVPENEWLKIMDQEYDPRLIHPHHSRVTHHVMGQICSLGYAVSQRGARRILYEMGVKKFDAPFDIMLRDICEGVNGRPKGAVCMTVEPQLFQHHRPVGLSKYISDISNHADEGIIDKPSTDNIRWSVRMNLPRLVLGETTMDDQYPDQYET
jgi:GR25 family glycosyltransferase involved in LPS biosynthesis